MLKKSSHRLKLLTSSILLCLGSTSNVAFSSTFVAPMFPVATKGTPTGAGRFGESRGGGSGYPRGYGVRMHQGVDISASQGVKLYAVADSTVLKYMNTGSGGGIGTVLKPNGADIVYVYWHQSNITPAVKQGTVKAGQHIGYSGGTASSYIGAPNAYAPHLHLGVGVPNPNNATQVWMNNVPKVGNFYKPYMAKKSINYGGKTFYWTNPAPYLSKDVIINTSLGSSDPYIKYIGNSIRSQYNALTGSNLPLGSGAREGQFQNLIPKVKISGNGVPSTMATETAQSAVLSAIVNGDGEEMLGQDTISAEELAYYSAPRTIFTGSNESVPIDIGDGDITTKELIDKIGSSRYGNSDWAKQLIDISMRGMLIEYLNIINAKNFIKKEHIKQKERIESLYSAWSAQVAKKNIGDQIQENLEKNVKADIIPEVSNISVEEIFDKLEAGYDLSSNELASAISMGGNQYKYCDKAFKANYSAIPDAYKRQLLALSLRLGYSPNDFLTAVGAETSFNMNKMYQKSYTDKNGQRRNPAGGFIQLMGGGAGDIPYNTIVKLYPQMKPILDTHLKQPYKANVKKIAHGDYLKPLGQLNPKYEFVIYDAYFFAKSPSYLSRRPSERTLVDLYRKIFGTVYYYDSKGYLENAQYDYNNDKKITAEEAVHGKKFRQTSCNYIDDSDVLSNKYGLTNEDLKYIPWNDHIKRLTPPTIDNLGGHFMFIQGLKERSKNES